MSVSFDVSGCLSSSGVCAFFKDKAAAYTNKIEASSSSVSSTYINFISCSVL